MRLCLCLGAVLAAGAVGAAAAASAPTSLTFSVFAHTGLRLGDVTWTGSRFLYVTQNAGELHSSGPRGLPTGLFAKVPPEVEEMRCLPSPGAHGFARGDVFCHSPRGTIWRITSAGNASAFATLPETEVQDGALAFDRAGGFGYDLLAATGGSASNGGTVYAIGSDKSVRKIGPYPGPGGADNIEMASGQFGTASNQLLIAIDKAPNPPEPQAGYVLAMRPNGAVRRLVSLPDGLNPIVVIGRGDAPPGRASPGVYLTDTFSTNVLFAPASQLSGHVGDVLVGGETTAHLWIVSPRGSGFRATRVPSNLRGKGAPWNLEGATWVG
jgi:hypothetical protein